MSVALHHGPDCSCARCEGFGPGNAAALRHGAYAALSELSPPVAAKFAELLEQQVAYHPADAGMVRLLAIVEVRIDRAVAAMQRVDDQSSEPLSGYVGDSATVLDRLRIDLAKWINLSRKLRGDLAMSATSRGRLGLDIALAQRASEQALGELASEGRRIRAAREEEVS